MQLLSGIGFAVDRDSWVAQGVFGSLLPRLVASILAHTLRPIDDIQRQGIAISCRPEGLPILDSCWALTMSVRSTILASPCGMSPFRAASTLQRLKGYCVTCP